MAGTIGDLQLGAGSRCSRPLQQHISSPSSIPRVNQVHISIITIDHSAQRGFGMLQELLTSACAVALNGSSAAVVRSLPVPFRICGEAVAQGIELAETYHHWQRSLQRGCRRRHSNTACNRAIG